MELEGVYCCMYAHALPSCPIAPRCTQVLVHAGGVRAHASGKCGCTQVESVAARRCQVWLRASAKCGCAQVGARKC